MNDRVVPRLRRFARIANPSVRNLAHKNARMSRKLPLAGIGSIVATAERDSLSATRAIGRSAMAERREVWRETRRSKQAGQVSATPAARAMRFACDLALSPLYSYRIRPEIYFGERSFRTFTAATFLSAREREREREGEGKTRNLHIRAQTQKRRTRLTMSPGSGNERRVIARPRP